MEGDVEQMVRQLKLAFVERVRQLRWLDEATAAAVVSKAEAVVSEVGLPAFARNATQLAGYYHGRSSQQLGSPRGAEYFSHVMEATTNARRHMLTQPLDQPPRRGPHAWEVTATSMAAFGPTHRQGSISAPTVDVFYHPARNGLVVPAGILQPPFYHADYLPALNYGGIGTVLGRALLGGFGERGSRYDQHGRLPSSDGDDWWSPAARAEMAQRGQCLLREDRSQSAADEALGSNLTVPDHIIADTGGLRAAFHAYRCAVGPAARLALPRSASQLSSSRWDRWRACVCYCYHAGRCRVSATACPAAVWQLPAPR
eukprot:COSAG01_NODE_129_length_24935_cov_39.324368_28_plen_314_part_00